MVAALGPEMGRKQLPSSKERGCSLLGGTAKLPYSRSSTGRQTTRAWYLSEQELFQLSAWRGLFLPLTSHG